MITTVSRACCCILPYPCRAGEPGSAGRGPGRCPARSPRGGSGSAITALTAILPMCACAAASGARTIEEVTAFGQRACRAPALVLRRAHFPQGEAGEASAFRAGGVHQPTGEGGRSSCADGSATRRAFAHDVPPLNFSVRVTAHAARPPRRSRTPSGRPCPAGRRVRWRCPRCAGRRRNGRRRWRAECEGSATPGLDPLGSAFRPPPPRSPCALPGLQALVPHQSLAIRRPVPFLALRVWLRRLRPALP
jgi:hypothetical protein